MKNILIALGALLGLLFLAGIAIVSLVDVNAHKPRIEAAVSDALGMEFRIQGKAGLHLFPSASISLSDIRLVNLGTDLAAAETIRVGVRLLPLFHRQVEITELILEKPVIRIEKLAGGKFNFETPPRSPKTPVKGGEGPGTSFAVAGGAVRNGTVIYLDRRGDEKTEISGIDFSLKNLSLPAASDTPLSKGISFAGELRVKEIKGKDLALTDLDAKITASAGVYDIRPFTVKLFGGKGEGGIRVDLAHRHAEVSGFILEKPVIRIEKGTDGKFNFGTPPRPTKAPAKGGEGPGIFLTVASSAVRNGGVSYVDKKNGTKTEISGIDLSLKNLSLPAAPVTPLSKGISFAGELRVKEIKGKDLALTDLDAKITASAGVYDIRPFTVKLFGGKGEGGIRVDLTRVKPDVQVKYALSNFRAEESLAAISQKKYLSGPMTLVPDLSFRGSGAEEMKRTARGQVLLRGEDLSLHGMDIDGLLSTVEYAQQMNLADVGAFLLAGPLGPVATKGYSFGGVSRAGAQGGESKIVRLVSEWTVNDGVAEAKDVAFTTRKNRIAMKGKLDILNERFVDITVAVLDAKGCAKVRQKISGPFRNPTLDKVSTLETAIEPILGLFQQTKQLVGRGECKPFYTGSVAQPR